MTVKNLFKPSTMYRLAVAASLILLISVAIVFHVQMKKLNQTADRSYASSKRQYLLEKIFSEISDRETTLRNFIITKDSTFLENDSQSKKSILQNLDNLDAFYSEEGRNYDAAQSLIRLSKNYTNDFERLYESVKKNKKNNLDLRLELANRAKESEQIRTEIFLLAEKEVAKLKIQGINHRYDIETSTTTAFALTVTVLVILVFALYRINAEFQRAKKLNQELNFSKEISGKAEVVANISHWKINMKTGKYFYSDNFYKMIGVPQNSFENPGEFQQYIHPEDRKHTISQHEESLKNRTPTSLVYRIIRNDGEIRYLKSAGEFTRNAKGDLVKIGVTTDITDVYQYQNKLEATNKSLTEINAELESFNQIVSHDLQEPLRKIQMFVSRIEDTEAATISSRGMEYFSKIKNSASRMQNLMIDLVNYSRTVKDNKVFVNTDLNTILDDVLLELSLNIEESKAKISVENLPELKVIPFQIHQLFINLISNSLKYSKEDIVPEIKISEEKIQPNETISNKTIKAEDFVKIVVSDNGIGFQQEFAEKIFQLFKRLETELHYAGTGLGLSICRKIVENHDGFIKAEGIPDVGATFTIYLKK